MVLGGLISRFANWRERDPDAPEQWWFASIAIPLLAATIGPFANVLSIAALVSYWREDLTDGAGNMLLAQLSGTPIKDPRWATGINAASLVAGYVGNFFLFCNFTGRIRYSLALPATIVLWFASALLLIGITIGMAVVCPPEAVTQSYTQAYWYAVIAAVLYSFCSTILLVNMLGFFLGHYGSHFVLTGHQRTLILQTFLFFIWLAGGAGVYSALERDWGYSNALYFCDVTILTIGFGDLTPNNTVGRALVIPYAIGGIVFLGLMITSLSSFMGELAQSKIIRARFNRQRVRTLTRSNTIADALQNGKNLATMKQHNPFIMRHIQSFPRTRVIKTERPVQTRRRLSLGLLREEKDRFKAMRRLEENTTRFKNYTTLATSFGAFIGLWLVGAIVFWQIERHTTSNINTFFDGFYFCYIALLSIGYGDFTPFSSAGRPFFVVWSLIAVPTVTLLIGAAGNTIVDSFDRATNRVADFTLLPRDGIWREFVNSNPWLHTRLEERAKKKAERERLEEGFKVGPANPEDKSDFVPQSLNQVLQEAEVKPSLHEQARRLAHAIRHVADDMKQDPRKKYNYEEWVEFTELIRFTSEFANDDDDGAQLGLIEWDWIGEDSPMMAEQTEPEWLLDRLSESMVRYIRGQAPTDEKGPIPRRESKKDEEEDDLPASRRVICFPDDEEDIGVKRERSNEDEDEDDEDSGGPLSLREKGRQPLSLQDQERQSGGYR